MHVSLAIWAFATLTMSSADKQPEKAPPFPAPFLKGVPVFSWAGPEQLCVGRENGRVEVVSIPSGKVVTTFEFVAFDISHLATSSDGRFLCVVGEEKEQWVAYVLDLQTKGHVARVPLRVRCAALAGAAKARGFIFGLSDGTLLTLSADWKPLKKKIDACADTIAVIRAVTISSDAVFGAVSLGYSSAGDIPIVRLYDLHAGTKCWSQNGYASSYGVTFTQSKVGHCLLYGDTTCRLEKLRVQKNGDGVKVEHLASIQNDSCYREIGVPANEGDVSYSTFGEVAIDSNGKVSVLAKWKPAAGWVRSLSMSPTGRYIGYVFFTDGNKFLCVYDCKAKEHVTLPDRPMKSKP